ncbi:MAG: HNH endonuclease family protein [Streptomyces sp.]|uniref:HNH endonuclease family protein n=1 Tax=Streptomyces sp. TaxID=1931 RepID=UPI003D6B8113
MPRRPADRAAFVSALAAGACLLAAGCEGVDVSGGGGEESGTSASPSSPSSTATGSAPADASGAARPFANPEGTKRGLAPLTSDGDRKRARDLIATLRTKGRGPRTGYERDAFGYAWKDSVDDVPLGRNGCDTRNDLLARDGQDLERKPGSDCVVVSMTLHDPYTGNTIDWRKRQAMEVQIDHVMPLSYDWQMGAARWPESKRERIANDPLNLIPVDGPTNSAKQDSGPASWLPPNKQIRCAYSVRFAQVALKYELPVTAPDKAMMLEQCGG